MSTIPLAILANSYGFRISYKSYLSFTILYVVINIILEDIYALNNIEMIKNNIPHHRYTVVVIKYT